MNALLEVGALELILSATDRWTVEFIGSIRSKTVIITVTKIVYKINPC